VTKRRSLCVHASDSKGRSLPGKGPPRTCAKDQGENGTVHELVDCRRCELWAAREVEAIAPASAEPKSAPVVVADCPHRSAEPVATVGCQTCTGRVELKVFSCAVAAHPTCTPLTAVAGHHCCATCKDRPAN
jgi:hypothetical protein